MSIQAKLNEQAIKMLPRIHLLILSANPFDANQMKQKALYHLTNGRYAPLMEMDTKEFLFA